MEFRDIKIEDKKEFLKYKDSFIYQNNQTCDFIFEDIFAWKEMFDTKIFISNDYIILKNIKNNITSFLPPISNNIENFKKGFKEIIIYTEKCNIPLKLDSISENLITIFDKDKYGLTEDINFEDYIYDPMKLKNLTGNKYKEKRNHINKFLSLYPNYIYKSYSKEDYNNLEALYNSWSLDHTTIEKTTIEEIIKNLDKLNYFIDCLYVNDRLIAFAIGTIYNDIGVTLIEKADNNYPGSYAMINKLFTINHYQNVKYINRQEDMGLLNLRKAKESYHPLFKTKKYILFYNNDYLKNQYKKLYQESFDDSSSYINYFFEHIYNPLNSYYLMKNEEIISMIHYKIKEIIYNNKILKIPFLHSIATKKEYQKKGYMTTLLNIAIKDLKDKNYPFILLYPEDNNFYHNINPIKLSSIPNYLFPNNLILKETNDCKILLEIYNKKVSNYNFYIKRNLSYYIKQLLINIIDNINTSLIYNKNNELLGYIMYKDNYIEELIYLNDKYYNNKYLNTNLLLINLNLNNKELKEIINSNINFDKF